MTKDTPKDGHDVLYDAAVSQQRRIDYHIKELDTFDTETGDIEDIGHAIFSIHAIEEEWILDEDVRRELSVIQQLHEDDGDE